MNKRVLLSFAGVLSLCGAMLTVSHLKGKDRDVVAYERHAARLGEDMGRPVFLRITKESRQLELLVKRPKGWQVMKVYPILGMSGELGPKLKEGDGQAPEGFYSVVKGNMNPKSSYHLSFNIGYPNAYDRAQGRTGSFIMVHGSVYSIGCFAMGDDAIEEIYTMVDQALVKGQPSVPVQIYPFDMTAERMAAEGEHAHLAFWKYLQAGWLFTRVTNAPFVPSE